MHITTIKSKEGMNLEEKKEGYMEGIGHRKGKGGNDTIIL